jgi:hypothetical protein
VYFETDYRVKRRLTIEDGRLTTGQVSYEASNHIAAAFGVATIALALSRFCLGLSAPSDRPTLTSFLN